MKEKMQFSGVWLLCTLLLGSACSPLKPLDLPPEYTAPPAVTPFWQSLERLDPHDWYVLLNNGPGALDWRLRAIDSATESIDLQTFLWSFDATGAAVLDHLLKAANRGVVVRILMDDTFLAGQGPALLALVEHANIEYRVFNPFKRRANSMVTRELINLAEFGRLDHRMHNKAMVFDNRIAIIGGRNLADEYFGLDEESNFRDLEVLLGGPIVEGLSEAFDQYWNDHWSFPIGEVAHVESSPEYLEQLRNAAELQPNVHREESASQNEKKWRDIVAGSYSGDAALLVDIPPQKNPANPSEAPVQVADELVELFRGAKQEILIVTAYLIPTSRLERAVAEAVSRGVNVRILTNSIGSNNHLAAHSAYRNHIGALLNSGADLYEVRTDAGDRDRYMLRPVDKKVLALHAKALVIDNDKVFIGSPNLDPRSLRTNTEMGILVVSESFNQNVRSAVEQDLSGANAWRLELQPNGKVLWVADGHTLDSQPATSFMQGLEDWFLSYLPIEDSL
jgi:putative cardiolipin synthase